MLRFTQGIHRLIDGQQGALIFYYLLYRLELIPVFISVWGFAGAVMHLAGVLLVVFGLVPPVSVVYCVLAIPVALNDMALAVWLMVKGFNLPSAAASGAARTDVGNVG